MPSLTVSLVYPGVYLNESTLLRVDERRNTAEVALLQADGSWSHQCAIDDSNLWFEVAPGLRIMIVRYRDELAASIRMQEAIEQGTGDWSSHEQHFTCTAGWQQLVPGAAFRVDDSGGLQYRIWTPREDTPDAPIGSFRYGNWGPALPIGHTSSRWHMPFGADLRLRIAEPIDPLYTKLHVTIQRLRLVATEE